MYIFYYFFFCGRARTGISKRSPNVFDVPRLYNSPRVLLTRTPQYLRAAVRLCVLFIFHYDSRAVLLLFRTNTARSSLFALEKRPRVRPAATTARRIGPLGYVPRGVGFEVQTTSYRSVDGDKRLLKIILIQTKYNV